MAELFEGRVGGEELRLVDVEVFEEVEVLDHETPSLFNIVGGQVSCEGRVGFVGGNTVEHLIVVLFCFRHALSQVLLIVVVVGLIIIIFFF